MVEFKDSENFFSNEENSAPKKEESKQVDLPYTLAFGREVELMGKMRSEITFQREPSVRCMRHIPVNAGLKFGHFIPIIVAMTDLSTPEIESLPPSIYNKCLEIVAPFLQDSETG